MNSKYELDRAEVLDWRETERLDIKREIKSRLSEIDAKINALIDGMSIRDAVIRNKFHNREIAPVVEGWLQELLIDFKQEIEDSAVESERALGNDPKDHAWSWGEITGAGAATAVTLAPLAVLPFAVGIATVSTTSFLVFTTSAVSIPILSAVVVGALVAGVGGEKFRRDAFNKVKDRYRKRISKEIRNKSVGDPDNPEAPSVCRSLQDKIDMIARKRLENLQ